MKIVPGISCGKFQFGEKIDSMEREDFGEPICEDENQYSYCSFDDSLEIWVSEDVIDAVLCRRSAVILGFDLIGSSLEDCENFLRELGLEYRIENYGRPGDKILRCGDLGISVNFFEYLCDFVVVSSKFKS